MRASMESYLERAMKAQAVILQAVAKKITLWRAAEIIGLSDRSMRRRRERYETHGYDGLRWRVRGCHRLGAGGDGEEPGTDACFSEARFRSFDGLVVVPSSSLSSYGTLAPCPNLGSRIQTRGFGARLDGGLSPDARSISTGWMSGASL